MSSYWQTFLELIVTPFLPGNRELIWGIVPLYFGWILNELTSSKASYRTAIQTGFSFLWAGAHWTFQYFNPAQSSRGFDWSLLFAVNMIVTGFVLLIGLVAFWSGIRRRYPRYCSFLGHSRFSNYFMIAIFPIQAGAPGMSWTWQRFVAIAIFAVPIWLVLHFGLKPVRK